MGKELFFLIDTGAKISILKEISDFFKYVRNNNTIKIQGLSQELTKSKALAPTENQTSKYIIPHDFHILNIQFAISCDRIEGIDFIKNYNCQLDFKRSEDWLIIRPKNLNHP